MAHIASENSPENKNRVNRKRLFEAQDIAIDIEAGLNEVRIEKQNQRQQALELEEMTLSLNEQGIDARPEEVEQSLIETEEKEEEERFRGVQALLSPEVNIDGPLQPTEIEQAPIEQQITEPVREPAAEIAIEQKPQAIEQIEQEQDFDEEAFFKQRFATRRSEAVFKQAQNFANTVSKLNKAGFKFTVPKPGEKLNAFQQSMRSLGIERVQGAGKIDNLKDVTDLRKEVLKSKVFNNMVEVDTAFNKIQEASKLATAAGDIAAVFNFMKILDPTSVVREGEFATAARAAGASDRIVNIFERVDKGLILTPDQRKDFLITAKTQARAQFRSFKVATQPIRNQIEQQGLDVELIFPKFNFDVAEEQKVKSIVPGKFIRHKGRVFKVLDAAGNLQEVK